ncbi:MAG: ANTAR domain-containing response regulator [Sulfuricaulis sp.]
MRLRILLVTDRDDRAALLKQALDAAHHQVVAVIRSDDDICFYAHQARPDAVMASVDQPGAALLEQLEQLSREQPLPVVVFADRSGSGPLRAAVKVGVSAYVVDGLEAARVAPVLETALTRFAEFQALRRERDAAVTRLSEHRRIERAKGILRERRGLSEKATHAALRRMADAAGKSLPEIAQRILAVEALLGGEAPPDDDGVHAATVSAGAAGFSKTPRGG